MHHTIPGLQWVVDEEGMVFSAMRFPDEYHIILFDHEIPKLKSLLFYRKRLLTMSLPILVSSQKINDNKIANAPLP